MKNRRALISFLGLTFGLTFVLVLTASIRGLTLFEAPAILSQIVVLVAMFVPALSAVVTQKLVLKKPLSGLGFRWGPWSMYAKVYGVVVLLFLVNYTVTWLFVAPPDWTLASFVGQFTPAPELPVPPGMMILFLSLVTFIAAPLLNMLPSLGEEIGWRGFLLPHLEDLGRPKAMVLSGVIWALWHTPMILLLGFLYGADAWPGALLHFVMVTGLGTWMGYIWFKTRSTVIAAFIHAVFNANAYGVWSVLFVSSNKLAVGAAGAIGAALCLILGVLSLSLEMRPSRAL